jgi:membrane protease YdiL (CAAX protease family)
MSAFLSFLAEIVPQGDAILDYSRVEHGLVLGVLLSLLLLCVGLALDVALVLYFIKRPPRVTQWCEALTSRALPGKVILLLMLALFAGYVGCSTAYVAFFPNITETDPSTLIFQGLVFNLPAALLIAATWICRRTAVPEPIGTRWRRGVKLFGLSILLYIAAVPILWFYGILYQLFLDQLGVDFSLQGVAEIFLLPASVLERIAMYCTAIILVPISEELLFRGVLLPWAVRRVGFWPGIALISLLFAAIHMHLPALLPLFLLSVFFCVAYARTRSLLVPICMHACFNGISILMLVLTGGG